MSIKDQKLLYHLTDLTNLESILKNGLLPRSQLSNFVDVADSDIVIKRQSQNLQDYVPFHFFSKNPFDLAAQLSNKKNIFILIAVRRDHAEANNWQVIPHHPLANETTNKMDYIKGIESIDWELMDQRDYSNTKCKSVCMAECLSPATVLASQFFKIFTPNEEIDQQVHKSMKSVNIFVNTQINERMFVKQNG
jgi:hypothetical protein